MIVDQKVKMVWNSTVKNYYTALGYEWTKQGQEFEVDVKHLQLYSNKKVKFVCDICDGENQIEDKYRWKTMANLQKERERNGSDCCFICAHERTKNTNIKNAVKLGEVFQRNFLKSQKNGVQKINLPLMIIVMVLNKRYGGFVKRARMENCNL
ncbi:hypothetical protein AAHH67_15395 [Niallia circulans]